MTEVMSNHQMSVIEYIGECEYQLLRYLPGLSYQDIQNMSVDKFFFLFKRLRTEIDGGKSKGQTPESQYGTTIQITQPEDM